MWFEINFNREEDDKTLEQIGAKLEPTNSTKYPPFETYKIEINTFEELEKLLEKVKQIKSNYYSAVISYDPPTIYLDKEI